MKNTITLPIFATLISIANAQTTFDTFDVNGAVQNVNSSGYTNSQAGSNVDIVWKSKWDSTPFNGSAKITPGFTSKNGLFRSAGGDGVIHFGGRAAGPDYDYSMSFANIKTPASSLYFFINRLTNDKSSVTLTAFDASNKAISLTGAKFADVYNLDGATLGDGTSWTWNGATGKASSFGPPTNDSNGAIIDLSGLNVSRLDVFVDTVVDDGGHFGLATAAVPVPEPSSTALLGLGALGLLARRKR